MLQLPDGAAFAATFADNRFYLALAIGLLTGVVRGFSGFGSAMIYVPLMSAVYGPQIAVVTFVIQDVVTGLSFLAGTWRKTQWRDVLIMAAGAIVAIQFGALILQYADPVTLRWVLCAVVATALIVLGSGWRYHGRPKLAITIGVGLLAGLMGGAVQISGPPVLVYWLGSGQAADILRANFFAYFSIFSSAALITYALRGLATPQVWALAIFITPTCILGMWLGSKAFGLAKDTTYRRTAYVIVAFSAIAGLPLWDHLR